MKKTFYIKPECCYMQMEQGIMAASVQTKLDETKDEQSVTPSDEEYNGEFGSKRSIWSDED